jgi:hypothetical protein
MAAPIIKWMIGKDAADTKAYLHKKAWDYGWIKLGEE